MHKIEATSDVSADSWHPPATSAAVPTPGRAGEDVLHSTHRPAQPVEPPVTPADKVAYAFYATAALSALVGQVWAGVEHIPWPDHGFPTALRIVLVAPALAVIELGGVATAALADVRRRAGERALAYRSMSLFAALVAAAFNLIGHKDQPYLAFGFTGLSAFAYVLWLAHSAARRRDALRDQQMLAQVAPVYGPLQWLREPAVTRRARSFALEHGYGLYESLRVAREEIRVTERRRAIAEAIGDLVKAHHGDKLHARIAATTYDMDRMAEEVEARTDYAGWGQVISDVLAPPPRDGASRLGGAVDKLDLPVDPEPLDGQIRGGEDEWWGAIASAVPAERSAPVEDQPSAPHLIQVTDGDERTSGDRPERSADAIGAVQGRSERASADIEEQVNRSASTTQTGVERPALGATDLDDTIDGGSAHQAAETEKSANQMEDTDELVVDLDHRSAQQERSERSETQSAARSERSSAGEQERSADPVALKARAFELLDERDGAGNRLSGPELARVLECSQSYARKLIAEWREARRRERLYSINGSR